MNTHTNAQQILFSMLALIVAGSMISSAFADDWERGKEIYAANCASCHGVTGQPDANSPLVNALGVLPANFADALFNSREPASTWKVVIAKGGQEMGFSEMMPAFSEALSEQDIDAVLVYIKTLGGEHNYPDGDLNLFLPLRTRKAFPEDEWVWKQRYTGQDDDNTWKNTLEYEFRVGERAQGVLELSHETKGSDSRFTMFEPGFKYVLTQDRESGYIATLGANVGIPTHSDLDWELLPYIAFGKILSESWTFQGSGRLKFNLNDSDKSSAEFAGVVHWVHTPMGRAIFPALELAADVPFHRGVGPGRKDVVQLSAIPQLRIGLNKRGNIALNTGIELPINDRERYDWRAYMFLIWDFADGGFFEGW